MFDVTFEPSGMGCGWITPHTDKGHEICDEWFDADDYLGSGDVLLRPDVSGYGIDRRGLDDFYDFVKEQCGTINLAKYA